MRDSDIHEHTRAAALLHEPDDEPGLYRGARARRREDARRLRFSSDRSRVDLERADHRDDIGS